MTTEPTGLEPILQRIVESDGTNGWKAERCLAAVASLPRDDLAKPELLSAAQAFATLAIADALYVTGTGAGIADALSVAGGY